MTNPVLVPGFEPGRHRRRPRRRVVVLVATAVLVGALSVSAAAVTRATTDPPVTRCTTLTVTAAPEMAPAIERVASSLRGFHCSRIVVSAADPARTATALDRGTAR